MPITSDTENHALMVDDLAAFTQNDLYHKFMDALRLEREEIINAGKKSRDPHILSKLDGFDQAATIFERARAIVVERNRPVSEDKDDQQDF